MPNLANNVTMLIPKKKVGSQKPSVEKKKLRVAAYARVSTDHEEQETSYEIQVEHYTTLIQSNPDWEFVAVYADDGISGMGVSKRGGFMQMIEDCRARKIDMILTKSISRFTRNTVDCLNYTRELRALNIAVLFEKENINTMDAAGEIMLTIMAAMAQQESESLSQNVRLGLKFRNEQGKVTVNHNWFLGYTKDEDGNLIIDEEQAEVVRRIYRSYLYGMSLKQIKRALEKDGIKNGAGHLTWYESNLRQILTNEKYIGDALLQKTWTYNVLDKKRRKNDSDVPQYYVSNNHEAIISKETFAAVQSEIARRANLLGENGRKRVYSGRYAYSGILFCGTCGDVMRRLIWNNRGKKKAVWRCAARIEGGIKSCSSRKIDEIDLHALTIRAINLAKDAHKTNLALVTECVSEGLDTERLERIASIDAEIKALQEQLLQLKSGSTEEEALGEKIICLRDERNVLCGNTALEAQRINDIHICAAAFAGMGAPLEEFDEQYLRALMEKIIVYEDRVVFYFKDGQEITINE